MHTYTQVCACVNSETVVEYNIVPCRGCFCYRSRIKLLSWSSSFWRIFRGPGHGAFCIKIKMNSFTCTLLGKAGERTWAPMYSAPVSMAEILCWCFTALWVLPGSGTQGFKGWLYFKTVLCRLPRDYEILTQTTSLQNRFRNLFNVRILDLLLICLYALLPDVLKEKKKQIFLFHKGHLLFSQFFRWWSWGWKTMKDLCEVLQQVRDRAMTCFHSFDPKLNSFLLWDFPYNIFFSFSLVFL